ncbi:MAG: LacI family transcriptional regulator [Clostridiales bacterium]|jgi:LacI family purine nucleotide synthesis repressor|nr:LacI family transcriptional regulator [Clostridiales bacterium]
MNKVTIKDVAREAGVSISTVSNALNNVDLLLPKTKEHILQVAEKLNYIPNQNGRNLKAKEAMAVGLFISALRGVYYGVLSDTLHAECRKLEYDLYIYIINQCRNITANVLGRRVDGAIILYEKTTEETLTKLKKSRSPVVFLDRELDDETISSVVFDSFRFGELAANYLISLGHRNIVHVSGISGNYDSEERRRGFMHALRNASLDLPPENIIEGFFEEEAASRELKRYLRSGHPIPDAIFASNDLSAIGCMEALREEGARVPEDVSVIGCDDIDISKMMIPALTTIHTNFEKQGVIAMELLMDMMKKGKSGAIKKISGELVIRKSCMRRIAD